MWAPPKRIFGENSWQRRATYQPRPTGQGEDVDDEQKPRQTDAVQLRRAQTKGVTTHVTVEIVSIRVTMVDLVR